MSKFSELSQNDTIFSRSDHLAKLRRMQRIARAKLMTYRFSKFFIVTLVCLSLIGAGTLSVFAGNKNQNHRPSRVTKSVKVSSGNNNHFGQSKSRASVQNNNSVTISSGGRGSVRTISAGNRNNGNNHNKKKVVRKKVVKKVTKKNVNNTTINVDIDKDIKYIPPKETNPCPCNNYDHNEYTYHSYPKEYIHKSYDNDYPSYKKDYSYEKDDDDQHHSYPSYRYKPEHFMIYNKNVNTNTNNNYNSVDY